MGRRSACQTDAGSEFFVVELEAWTVIAYHRGMEIVGNVDLELNEVLGASAVDSVWQAKLWLWSEALP